MNIQTKVPLRRICLGIGILHLILVISGVYEKTWELIVLQEPFIVQDHMTIIISYGVQSLTVFMLIYGCLLEKPNFTIPWLMLTTPFFIIGTFYGLLVIFKTELSQTFYNLLSICSIWIMWIFVIKYNLQSNRLLGSLLKYIK